MVEGPNFSDWKPLPMMPITASRISGADDPLKRWMSTDYAVREFNMATNDNTVILIKSLGSNEAGDKIWCWFSPFENHEVSSFLQNCLRFHFSPGSLVEEIVFVELLLMTPPGHGVICGQGLGQNRSLLFVWYCTVCCKVDKKYCTVCCKDRRCLCPDSWQEKVSRSRNASPPREKWRRIA